MGQGFSLTALAAGTAGIDVPELHDLVYEKSMGNARFMKSIRARHQNGVVLVKVLVKPYPMKLEKYKRKLIHERKVLADVPNVLAYQRIIETETNGYLVRQFLHSSLYDRISTRPFLEEIEKKWLAYQLLRALADIHARDIFHGDIKTENTLLTSWNWLYLSDFSSSFKPTYMPSDNPAEYHYFFGTFVTRGPQTQPCYTAPERFVESGKAANADAPITWAMDIFSAGCVLAELFLEGPLLTLEGLFRYQRGELDISTQLGRIADKDVRDMIMHMLQIDPEKRFSAEEYLQFWQKKVFPDYFYSFLHQYMGLVTDPSSGRNPISGASTNLGEPDERIERVYYDFDKIAYFLGYESEKVESEKHTLSGHTLDLFPVHLSIPNNEHQLSSTGRKTPMDDGTPLFLALVASSLRNTARSTAKIHGCELLLAFSERLTDEAKLDRVLPHLIMLSKDPVDIVKVAAIRSITQLLALVTVVSPMNAHIFPEYIMSHMKLFLEDSKTKPGPFVRATYAACLGSLATSASRYADMVATLRADGSLPTMDAETDEGSIGGDPPLQALFDNTRAELILEFGAHTKSLITDAETAVRRAFLVSVPELCMFFGTADSNDIILSHLNTYLNDRNWMLKCAFFETIVGVATFLGGTSLEEFILPLMVQALTDPEEFVIQRVLSSFASMAELGLFSRSKTWELVDVVGRFTMHPNIWIREAAANFLSASTLFLSVADNQCIILPLIKPYLKTSIKDFSELALLDNLKKPFPRSLLDLSMTWALKVDRGIFWKQADKLHTFSFDSNSMIPTISARELGPHALQRVPKNEEDEQWLSKLRNMGLNPEDDFKLLCLREYIWRLANSKSRQPKSPSNNLNNIVNLRKINITPQTVLFDEKAIPGEVDHAIRRASYESNRPHTIADALLDASMTIDDPIAKRRRSAFNNHHSKLNSRGLSPIVSNGQDIDSPLSTPGSLPDAGGTGSLGSSALPINGTHRRSDDETASIPESLSPLKSRVHSHDIKHRISAMNLIGGGRKVPTKSSKSSPETGTTSANAFGKVEGPFSHPTGEPSALASAKGIDNGTEDVFKFRGAHTYEGSDPHVLKMLDAMYVDNYPTDIAVFGPMIAPSSRPKAINRSTTQPVNQPWKPEGILVATFSEHIGPLHHIAVAPDHVFFLTGGDDGCIKVWDTGRLERNIAHRSRATHKHAAGAKIMALTFAEHTHSFVSCASDGSINVVRVDCALVSGTMRYDKLRLVREYQLPQGEMAVWSTHFKVETSSTLIIATNLSRVLAIDLRTMSVMYTLENPVHHGTPTCFVVDKKRQWLLLGTSHGVLDLWDLRFKVRLKAWGVPGATAIYRITIHPTKGRGRWVCVAGGSGQGEVTVWDVEKTQCREVFRAVGTRQGSKGYEPWPVDEDRPEGMLGRFATALEPTGSSTSDRGVRAMITGTDSHDNGREAVKYGFIVTGGSDRKLRFWDLSQVENSTVVSGLDVEEKLPTFTSAHPTATLILNTESLGRPGPTAPNASASSRSPGTSKSASTKPPRSTVISLQQQQLLKSHLDSILDVALIESPYGMLVSVDRSGVVFIFQ